MNSGSITAVAYHPKGTILVSTHFDKTIILWNVRTGLVLRRLTRYDWPDKTLSFDKYGRMLVTR